MPGAAIVFLEFCHALSGLHRLLRLLQIPLRQPRAPFRARLCAQLAVAAALGFLLLLPLQTLAALQINHEREVSLAIVQAWPGKPVRTQPPRHGCLN